MKIQMKKSINYIFFSLIVLIVSSCINYTQVTTIKTDNSGKMFIHYWKKVVPELDSLFLTKVGIFNEDSLKTNFTASFNKIHFVKVFKNNTDTTLHAQVEFEFSNLDSLNLLPFFKGAALSIKNGEENTKIFSQFIQPVTINTDSTNSPIKIKYTYYLPGEIIKHNANYLSRNKLIWEFSLNNIGNGKIISATYIPFKLKETPRMIYYLALGVIIIVMFFLFSKKKKWVVY